jgi:hypothetical protein
MSRHWQLFLFFFAPFWGFLALTSWAAKEDTPTMFQFRQELNNLKPYIIDSDEFKSEGNEKEIQRRLKVMTTLAEHTNTGEFLKKKENEQTVQFLVQHLRKTEMYFQNGNKELARYMLQSTIHTCISCHSRLPADISPTDITLKSLSQKKNPFEEAEFEFATRRFSNALASFDYVIMGYPKNKVSLTQVLDSLEYTATIYARIQKDPKKGARTFQRYLKNNNIPLFIKEDLNNWIADFQKWSVDPLYPLETHSDQEILEKVKTILGPRMNNPFYLRDRSNHIAYLRASGLLHEFFQLRPQSQFAPEAYYLMGICYLTLDQDFFMDFDRMYLRTCIQEYPKSPIAKKCYNLLEESIYLGYSGSSGTHIPLDVMKELNRFKKRIY